jgi:hypothetical protein
LRNLLNRNFLTTFGIGCIALSWGSYDSFAGRDKRVLLSPLSQDENQWVQNKKQKIPYLREKQQPLSKLRGQDHHKDDLEQIAKKKLESSPAWKKIFKHLKASDLRNRWMRVLVSLKDSDELAAATHWIFQLPPFEQAFSETALPDFDSPEAPDEQLLEVQVRLIAIFHEIHHQMVCNGREAYPEITDVNQIYAALRARADQVIQDGASSLSLGSNHPQLNQVSRACQYAFPQNPATASQCSRVVARARMGDLFWKSDPYDLLHHTLKHSVRMHKLQCRFTREDLEAWLPSVDPLPYEEQARQVVQDFADRDPATHALQDAWVQFVPGRSNQNQGGSFRFCLPVLVPGDTLRPYFRETLVSVLDATGHTFSMTTFLPRVDRCGN